MKVKYLLNKVVVLAFLFFTMVFSQYAAAESYKFVGKFLLEYSIFKIDVYEISYFKGEQSEKLLLDYKTSVKKKYSQEGWKVGLEHKMKDDKNKEKAKWLLDNTVDLAKGDKLEIVKTQSKVQLFKNKKLVAEIDDQGVADLAFEPWLGEKPVDDDLKKALLGIKGD